VYCYWLVYMNDPWMTHLQWRVLLQQGSIPSLVFFGIAFIFLLQSPYFAAVTGKKSDAQDILKTMQRDNCIPIPDIDLDFEDVEPVSEAESASGAEFKVVFNNEFFSTTVIVTYSCFVMNFVFYGALYAFPNVLPTLSKIGRSSTPAMELLIGALWEFPGYALAVVFAMQYARKPVMKLYAFSTGISMILFALGVYISSDVVWHLGFWGIKIFICIGYVVIYVYLSEVFPTKVRVTGGAVGIAGGRIGAMIAPLAYEMLTAWTGSFYTFFLVTAIMCLTNMPLIDLLPYETFGASLVSKGGGDTTQTYGAVEGQRV